MLALPPLHFKTPLELVMAESDPPVSKQDQDLRGGVVEEDPPTKMLLNSLRSKYAVVCRFGSQIHFKQAGCAWPPHAVVRGLPPSRHQHELPNEPLTLCVSYDQFQGCC